MPRNQLRDFVPSPLILHIFLGEERLNYTQNGEGIICILVVRESWMYFSYTSQQTSGVYGLSAPCCDIATPAYLGSGLGRRVGPCHDELSLSYSLGRKGQVWAPLSQPLLPCFQLCFECDQRVLAQQGIFTRSRFLGE